MNPLLKQFCRLLDERPEGPGSVFVPGRNDFDHRDNPITGHVSYGDQALATCSDSALSLIWPKVGRNLFWQSVVRLGQQTAIQLIADLADPPVVKCVEDSGFDAVPVVHWHDDTLLRTKPL